MVTASAPKKSSHHDIESMMTRFVASCRERGLSVTPQRLALYRALVGTTSHPTPEMLFAEVREQMPTLSLATVYKAIETFKDMGLIREIRVPDDHRMRLDADVSVHHHLICVQCRSVVDLRMDLLEGVCVPSDLLQGFKVQSCSLQFTGVCSECEREPEL